MTSTPWSSGAMIPRRAVQAGPGTRIIARGQLADQRVFQALKADIFNPESGLTVIDPATTVLEFEGRTIDADSPEGQARLSALQSEWVTGLQQQRALGDALSAQPATIQLHSNQD